ncbi:MAG TPA: LamG-like jellyroll fold domain-containing protein, partial [Humisphaera sp.]|nr:LamG-like jellyroll fold domain-containing protein [Humisphaera sp.]
MLLSATDVLTYHNDLGRTGQNLNETILTPANVNQNSFGKLFTDTVDGQVYGQPLYVNGVVMSDGKTHNVVYVTTEHDSVYAFDADAPGAPLWKKSFINPAAGVTTVPSTDVGTGDLSPEIGITGTGVIDRTNNTLYVVAKTKEVTNGVTTYVQRLHALDITTGAEKFGGPVAIAASATGTGAGTDANGKVHFDALRNNQRTALALINGVVYICWAAHGDVGVYHGWVIGYNELTLQQTFAYCVTPNGSEGGVWMAGGAPVADSSGNIYVSVGNGSVDGKDFGESILKLNPNNPTQPADYFVVYNWSALNANDRDFGSSGLLMLTGQGGPVPNELIAGGKEGRLYVVNRDNLGHVGTGVTVNGATVDDVAVQEFPGLVGQIFDTPVYFNGRVYLTPSNDQLKSYTVSNGLLTFENSGPFTASYPGGALSVSANGSTNGILWEMDFGNPSILRAFNPANLDQEYWDSNVAGARDQLDSGVKFASPTIANGHVYVGTATTLTVFGLGPVGQAAPAAPSNLSAVAVGANEVRLAWNDNSSNETSFSIERSTDGVNFTYLGAAAAQTNSFSDTSAKDGTTYYYRIRAANFSTSAPSNIASATTANVNNLVGYWTFDEGASNIAADHSGTGNNGTLSGETTWSLGLVGASAINFHGAGVADAHVAVPNSSSLQFTAAQSFTVGAWIRPNALPGKWAGIVTKSADLGNGYGIYIDPNNKWAFATQSDVNVLEGTAATTVSPTRPLAGWHYVAIVQNGAANTRTLYVDGAAVATGTAFNASGGGDLWIGGSKGNNTQYFNGAVDDVRIYSRALSASEIQTFATHTLPSPWTQQDIGTSAAGVGNGTYANGTFNINGTGADINSTADAFHYVYQNLNGDGQIVARVASQQNTNTAAKAGVMIRQGTGTGSIFADVVVTPGAGVLFTRRTAASSAAVTTTVASVAAPAWVKLTRVGNTMSAFWSADGKTWNLIGTATVTMTGTVLIGLAVTSTTTLAVANARFDNVTVSATGTGTGLLADYYAAPTFSSYKLSRLDSSVNFNWSPTPPDPSVGPNNFSVRWVGSVQPLYTETYTFFVTAADGVRLWVDGQLIIDDFNDHAATQDSAAIALVGGQKYDIRLDYQDHADTPSVKLEWSSPSQSRQVIPTAQLSPTTAAVSG